MNILFYSPLESRSRDTESVMEAFVQKGERVWLLTQHPSPIYHAACQKLGVHCFSTPVDGINGLIKKYRQISFLVRFCQSNCIDVVYAQLEPANFIAVLAQYFMQAKVILVRHHVDIMETDSTRFAHWISILSYRMARHILVVSNKAKEYMVKRERVSPGKIWKINLGYNFAFWQPVDEGFVAQKRNSLKSDFVMVTACRMVQSKRIDLCLRLVKKLRERNIDCCLIILGEGPEWNVLREMARDLDIESYIFFEGYVNNVIEYVTVSDMMIHLSLTESSATVIKEAGLARKPVLACHDVGDFDDYIIDGFNGFLVERDAPFDMAMEKILSYFENRSDFGMLGENLYRSVVDNFSIEHVFSEYQTLNEYVVQEDTGKGKP